VAVGSLVPKDKDGVVFTDMSGFEAQIIGGTRREGRGREVLSLH